MKPASPRSSFASSKLIRTLSAFNVVEMAESKQPLAERLGQWLGFTDALALFPIVNATPANTAPTTGDKASDSQLLRDELTRVRTALTRSIAGTDMAELAAQARIELPPLAAGEEEAPKRYDVDFFPYRRQYLGLQRAMAVAMEALRGKAREALSKLSPRLKQLADLDAGLEQALFLRERDLLAAVATLLEKRFDHLRISQGNVPGDPGEWTKPGGWLTAFHADFQAVLLAELELRLQPLSGLVEAHCNYEVEKSQ
jgi:hypothetical protein